MIPLTSLHRKELYVGMICVAQVPALRLLLAPGAKNPGSKPGTSSRQLDIL